MRNPEKKAVSDARFKAKCWRRSIRCGAEIYNALVRMREISGISIAEYVQTAIMEKYGNFPLKEMQNESRQRWNSDPV